MGQKRELVVLVMRDLRLQCFQIIHQCVYVNHLEIHIAVYMLSQ